MCHEIQARSDCYFYSIYTRKRDFYVGRKCFKVYRDNHNTLRAGIQDFTYEPEYIPSQNYFRVSGGKSTQYVAFKLNARTALISDRSRQEYSIREFPCGFHINPVIESRTKTFYVRHSSICSEWSVPVIFGSNDILFFDGIAVSVDRFYFLPPTTYKLKRIEVPDYTEFYKLLEKEFKLKRK
jgi:hypothetical protein